MKNVYLFFVLIFVLLAGACSVTKKVSNRLAGKYVVSSIKSVSESGSAYSGVVLDEIFKKSYMEFNPDNTFDFFIAGKNITGKWKISDDGKKILTDKNDFYFDILSYENGNFKLKSFNKGKSLPLFLKKISE